MQRIGLIPSDDDTSSTSSVGARLPTSKFQCHLQSRESIVILSRFGGADRGEEGSGAEVEEGEDSIDQGPWGLAAYAYYWWSGATGQVSIFHNLPRYQHFPTQTDRFTRSWSAFMNVWNSY